MLTYVFHTKYSAKNNMCKLLMTVAIPVQTVKHRKSLYLIRVTLSLNGHYIF